MPINLVTLEEYKTYAGITNPTSDAQINSIIDKTSALVKSICRRAFVDYATTAKVEIFSGGHDRLLLTEFPVIEIVSVEVTTDYGASSTTLEDRLDYITDVELGEILAINAAKEFTKYPLGYTVTYKAGYVSLPEDLKLAVLDLITYYFKNDAAVHSTRGIGSNNVQIEYITNVNLPAHIKRVLDLYMGNYL